MTRNYWLAVAAGEKISKSGTVRTWWCLPPSAAVGDRVLFYCPRSASASRHGVYAEGEVVVPPESMRKENSYCSGYGKGVQLCYAEVDVTERFGRNLTAKLMKADRVLGSTKLIKLNFQGTTFNLGERVYLRIKGLLAELAAADVSG